MSLIDNPTELHKLINDSLKQPKTFEKREFGEVFTPMPIIEEMLDVLDEHYKLTQKGNSIFANKDFKWFDPACGIGNFQIATYLRLINGLSLVFPDFETRKKHILKNMLYMSELNENNVAVCRNIFDKENKYNINIHTGDTLLMKNGDFKYDVVFGNPPYNTGGIHSCSKKHLGTKNQTIWPKFVNRALNDWLKPGGYLAYINPLSWLKSCHSMHIPILERKLLWLKLWDGQMSYSVIKGAIPISLYILENTITDDIQHKTTIIAEIKRKNQTYSENIHLNKEHSVPLAFHSIFHKLDEFIKKNDCGLVVKNKTVKAEKETQTLPPTHELSDNLAVHTYRIKDGLIVSKALSTHPDVDKRKLIIANKRDITIGLYIDDGKLSLSGYNKYYILGDSLELLKKMLDFDIFKIVNNFTKYTQDFINSDAFVHVPDIRKIAVKKGITVENLTEDKFYKMLNLTKTEIENCKLFKKC